MDDFEDLKPAEKFCYTAIVEEQMHYRLDKIIQLLNHISDQKYTKQGFITSALLEKLDKSQKSPVSERSSKVMPIKERRLRVEINTHLNEKIMKEIQSLKTIQPSYSKKTWILEAISEKLEREEQKTAQAKKISKKSNQK